MRNEAGGASLTAVDPQRISALLPDVTDEAHLAALAGALPAHLDAMVNNAGIVMAGPMEAVTSDQWRKQLKVNVIGQLAVTRAVLPRLRAAGGRVVFISSVNGRLSTPLTGAYAASKFALEVAADALRMELSPWHIPVILIEPAQTDTDMWRTADTMVDDAEAKLSPGQRELYLRHVAGMRKSVPNSQRLAVAPESYRTWSARRSPRDGRVPATSSASDRAYRWR